MIARRPRSSGRFAWLDTATPGGLTLELEQQCGRRRSWFDQRGSVQPRDAVRVRRAGCHGRQPSLGAIRVRSSAIEPNVSLDRRYRGAPGTGSRCCSGGTAPATCPSSGSSPTQGTQRVRGVSRIAHGEGLHHLGLDVSDMDAALARLTCPWPFRHDERRLERPWVRGTVRVPRHGACRRRDDRAALEQAAERRMPIDDSARDEVRRRAHDHEKHYVTRAGTERWERVKPFSTPGHDDVAHASQLVHDFGVALAVLEPKPGERRARSRRRQLLGLRVAPAPQRGHVERRSVRAAAAHRPLTSAARQRRRVRGSRSAADCRAHRAITRCA